MSAIKLQCPPQTYSRLFRPWDTARINTNVSPRNHAASATAAPSAFSIKYEYHKPATPKIAAHTRTIKSELMEEELTEDVDMEGPHSLQTDDSGSAYRDCPSGHSNSSDSTDEDCTAAATNTATMMRSEIYNAAMYRSAPFPSATHPPTTRHHPVTLSPVGVPALSPRLFAAGGPFEAQPHFPQMHQHHHHQPPQQQPLPLLPIAATATANDFYCAAAAAAAANGLATSPLLPPAPPLTLPSNAAAAAAATAASFAGMDAYAYGLVEQEYARVMAEDAHLKAINARKQRPKKFKCPHCDVAFSNNGQLKGHIRIHTGERPYKCDVESCGKTFTRNEELTRHKRIHTGLRPYPCAACGKKFGRRDHLKKHMKTHMPQERQLGPAIFVSMYPYLYNY